MARRSVEVIDVVEILQHWYALRSKSQIGVSVGADRGTVAKYVAKAEQAGIVPGGAPIGRDEWALRVREWFPELVDAKARSLTYPDINRLRDVIEAMLTEVTVSTAFQRCRDEHGLSVGVTAFRQYVRLEFPTGPKPEAVTLWRPPVAPGGEAQIDYGFLGSWLDPATQRLRRVWAFVMVLACSRHMFVRPVFSLNAVSWAETHVAAFEYFGGVPARLVPEYVPRNIFGLLCPTGLCGGLPLDSAAAGARRLAGHITVQRLVSQVSRVSSVCQIGRRWGSAEELGGSVSRSAAILALVLISA